MTKGILSRIAVITDTDILDENGNSLYGSLIMGVHTTFAYGTKTQRFHENWYPAQPGWEACPVRLLLKWLKAYDQLLAADSGTRLAGWHPLFSNLKHPGEPINTLSRTLGKAVKTSMARIGRPPDAYSAHSLRKFRASHVLSQGRQHDRCDGPRRPLIGSRGHRVRPPRPAATPSLQTSWSASTAAPPDAVTPP